MAVLLGLASACNAQMLQSARSEKAIDRHEEVLSKALEAKNLSLGSPVFIRITKTQDLNDNQGILEIFVKGDDEVFELFKAWDICNYSGVLGPKLKQGDGQSPEGFYFVKPNSMNPFSNYHLSFNLGYPNAFDRAHGRTGDYLMVHGDCVSIGCYAMTDSVMEQIYTLMDAAFRRGQPFIRVHIFPFPMSQDNLNAYKENENIEFWNNLKTGWDWFEENAEPPNVRVKRKRYIFGAIE